MGARHGQRMQHGGIKALVATALLHLGLIEYAKDAADQMQINVKTIYRWQYTIHWLVAPHASATRPIVRGAA